MDRVRLTGIYSMNTMSAIFRHFARSRSMNLEVVVTAFLVLHAGKIQEKAQPRRPKFQHHFNITDFPSCPMTHNQPSRLTGSQDLLTYFNIIPIYNKYVRPYSPPNRAAGLDPTLSSYIANLPGKNDMEPDGYLLNLLRDPQAVESGAAIRPLDAETLKEAFSLKEGPIPRVSYSVIYLYL
ncbi:uncharacterized protein BYT42DRAFT_400936 [Radiomyces spectabilis]|uniref:uncharacterized protein n=1 Tax=Radiomyces spectabilis TaxID=64574 RepID=UPI00221F3574|nr:uncharacterized protein BYT42DRAFT_400936 [Radiomyces spectabilis]KAI8374356.1 hypothetical protein BYT42DRAFT_400936 [Radiomyces spectabilis]